MAEEVGVEPTSRFNNGSTALKAERTTGCIALPPPMITKDYGFAALDPRLL